MVFLFGGSRYDARGGVRDYVGAFPTIEAARAAAWAREPHSLDWSWWHIAAVTWEGLAIVEEDEDCFGPEGIEAIQRQLAYFRGPQGEAYRGPGERQRHIDFWEWLLARSEAHGRGEKVAPRSAYLPSR